jgi:hypothetical protein
MRGNLCATSVEEKRRGIWAKWANYCNSSSFDGEPWVTHIMVFSSFTIGPSSTTPVISTMQGCSLDGFFQWLSDNNSGKTDIKNAKIFLNAHL